MAGRRTGISRESRIFNLKMLARLRSGDSYELDSMEDGATKEYLLDQAEKE